VKPAAVALSDGISSRTPQAAWSRRVRRVGGFIQAAFAAFWLIRGSLAVSGRTGTILAGGLGLVGAAAFGYGIRATAGTARRPHGVEASRIERDVTIATVVQLIASFVAPAIVLALGHSTLVLPSIAITIGPLLLWLDYRVVLRRYRPVGWTLIVGPIILVATVSGTALVVTTGIAAGVLMMATAVAGFHDLAASREMDLPTAGRVDPDIGSDQRGAVPVALGGGTS
jgi:hypothetical protein